MKIENWCEIENVNIGDHSVLRYLEIGCYFSVIFCCQGGTASCIKNEIWNTLLGRVETPNKDIKRWD